MQYNIRHNTTWHSKVHFYIENAQFSFNFTENFGSHFEIFDASIFFENGKIHFTNDRDVTNTKDFYPDLAYFSGSKIKCKLEIY